MPSPFPGMDPYLERPGYFETFHGALPTVMMGALNRQIRPKYIAQLGTQVYVDEAGRRKRELLVPDAYVVRKNGGRGVALVEERPQAPASVLMAAVRPRKQRYIKILDKSMERVVTAIEVLSPANKSRKGFREYEMKRQEYRAARISLVEIDLLRGGHRPQTEEPLPAGDYFILVCRAYSARAEVWPIKLRERLPQFRIPLDEDDPDAILDMQSLFERVYEEAGWDAGIYKGNLKPPLRDADAAWTRKVLARTTQH